MAETAVGVTLGAGVAALAGVSETPRLDAELLLGSILVLAMFFVGLNLIVDVMQTALDPRIERG